MREEIDKARQSSASPNSPAWVIWESEQSRKVAVKRIAKYVDLTPEAQKLISWDHAIYGDPTMQTPLLEGPSPEYQNQHVKAETEANLEALKEKIEPKDNGDEPREEHGTQEDWEREKKEMAEGDLPHEPDPEPEIIDEPVRAQNHWEDYILDFVVTEQFVSGADEEGMRIHARGILNYSPFVEIPHGELKLVPAVAWFMAWNRITEKHPKTKSENKAKKVLKLWEAEKDVLLELAKVKCPPETQ